MTRLILVLFATISIILIFLGITFLKDSYKLLPLAASKEGATSQFSSWRDYTSPSGGFSVMVPAFPQNATQTTRDPKTKQVRKYDMYVSEKSDGTLFMISLIKFPESKEAPEILQKSVVNDLLAANPTNQLKTMKVGELKGNKTLDFSIENGEMTIEGRTFTIGDTLYMISAIFRNSSYNPEEFNYFVSSFDLAEPKP